jgi:predicted transport protein
MLKYVKPERIFLKNHPQFDERWVQERIAEDPSLLGLGDLILKDKERIQPNAGRLDLLLQDIETDHRYEVEIQLGKTDETHIIRTIEYWDIERKRYPQYEHTAVIVAEEITSRFLNVIGLFNGFIPLVAIQMQAYRTADQVALIFTTVLNEMRLGADDEDEEILEPADRAYWEGRSSKDTLQVADQVLSIIKSLDEGYALKYNIGYIGLARNGRSNNFIIMSPKRNWLRLGMRLDRSEEWDKKLDEAGLDSVDYGKNGRYRIRLTANDMNRFKELIGDLIKTSYEQNIR